MKRALRLLWAFALTACATYSLSPCAVLTDAHCVVDPPGKAVTRLWVAHPPNGPGTPTKNLVRVTYRVDPMVKQDLDRPEIPDVALVYLDTPLILDAYAVPTVVTKAELDSNKVFGIAVGRAVESAADGRMVMTAPLAVMSDRPEYTHGLSTEMYSSHGDSGGGLFRAEVTVIDGKLVKSTPSHKLIGLERQPEPDGICQYE